MIVCFFDLDGTLEDSRQDMAEAVNRTRSAFGLAPMSFEDARTNVNRGMTELYRTCFADWIANAIAGGKSDAEALESVRVAYERDYLEHVADHTRLYDGVAEMLGTLSRQAKCIVITNKPERISRALLKQLGVGDQIADVMGGDSCAETKPSALPLRLAAERVGFKPGVDQAFMIGDSVADVLCGQAFGAKTLWAAWGYLAQAPEPAPHRIVRHPNEVVHAVLGL